MTDRPTLADILNQTPHAERDAACLAAEQALITSVVRRGGQVPTAAELRPLFERVWSAGWESGARHTVNLLDILERRRHSAEPEGHCG